MTALSACGSIQSMTRHKHLLLLVTSSGQLRHPSIPPRLTPCHYMPFIPSTVPAPSIGSSQQSLICAGDDTLWMPVRFTIRSDRTPTPVTALDSIEFWISLLKLPQRLYNEFRVSSRLLIALTVSQIPAGFWTNASRTDVLHKRHVF